MKLFAKQSVIITLVILWYCRSVASEQKKLSGEEAAAWKRMQEMAKKCSSYRRSNGMIHDCFSEGKYPLVNVVISEDKSICEKDGKVTERVTYSADVVYKFKKKRHELFEVLNRDGMQFTNEKVKVDLSSGIPTVLYTSLYKEPIELLCDKEEKMVY